MIKIVVKIVPLRLRSTNAIWRKPTIGSAALTESQQPRPQRWRTLHKFEQGTRMRCTVGTQGRATPFRGRCTRLRLPSKAICRYVSYRYRPTLAPLQKSKNLLLTCVGIFFEFID